MPTTLEDHLGNLCVKVPVEIYDLFLEWLAAKVTNKLILKKQKLNN